MHTPIITALLCAVLLMGCGQQATPETANAPTPAATTPPASPRKPPPATRPEDQVGMAAATQESAPGQDIDNPTGRTEHGQAGRGQGPAPGQHGNAAPTGQGTDAVTEQQALADCGRLPEPHKGECIDKLRRGHDADDTATSIPRDERR